MRRWAASILLSTCCLLAACSAPTPTWRSRVTALVTELGRQDAPRLFPQEYGNLVETFEHGEAVLHVQGDDEEADGYYLLALQKGELLNVELRRLKLRQAELERLRLAEQKARAEEERLLGAAAKAEQRLRDQQHSKVADESRQGNARGGSQDTEHQVVAPARYTVHRGETLPQIAGRSEIYNQASLWPIIYRANRDQIRDPKHLWPGQVLKIPRNFSRDEANEAKRYSGKK
jgi:nucleoid-associated protein YgaU